MIYHVFLPGVTYSGGNVGSAVVVIIGVVAVVVVVVLVVGCSLVTERERRESVCN
jgi:uncharacterized membrane protein